MVILRKKTPIGNLVVQEFKKPSDELLFDNSTTTTYEIKDPVCGETDIPTKYVKLAEKFDSNLKTGTCASVGYTVPDGNTTKKTPIGNLVVQEFKKPSFVGGISLLS